MKYKNHKQTDNLGVFFGRISAGLESVLTADASRRGVLTLGTQKRVLTRPAYVPVTKTYCRRSILGLGNK